MTGSAPMRKIFCIGLNKTGTMSLHDALVVLGFRSLHWGGPAARALVRRALEDGKPLVTYLDGYDAYSDLEELTYNFTLVDAQYPGSRFILTIRMLDDWLDSRRRHVEKNRERRAAGKYGGPFLDVDIDAWTEDYLTHHRRVREHFAGRPHDLLEMDVTAGAGWEPLCEFLDRPIPGVGFPWSNRYRPFRGVS